MKYSIIWQWKKDSISKWIICSDQDEPTFMKKHELDTCTNYVYEKIHFVATEMTLKVRSYEKLAWNWWIKAIAHANANATAKANAHAKRWPNLNICNKNEILRIAKIVFSGVFLNDDRAQCDTLCGTVRQAVQRLQSMLITIELETILYIAMIY